MCRGTKGNAVGTCTARRAIVCRRQDAQWACDTMGIRLRGFWPHPLVSRTGNLCRDVLVSGSTRVGLDAILIIRPIGHIWKPFSARTWRDTAEACGRGSRPTCKGEAAGATLVVHGVAGRGGGGAKPGNVCESRTSVLPGSGEISVVSAGREQPTGEPRRLGGEKGCGT